MRLRLLSNRPSVTRTSRHDPRGAALESVAAEFALLAQRRARLARQLDLLGRQLDAATSSLDAVQSRMMLLTHRMDSIDPGLRPDIAVVPPPPAPVLPLRAALPSRHAAAAAPPSNIAPTPRLHGLPRTLRPVLRRRPFLPE